MEVSSLLPHSHTLPCQRRGDKTFVWEKHFVSRGKQGGLAEQKAQLCPFPLPLAGFKAPGEASLLTAWHSHSRPQITEAASRDSL